MVFRSRMNGQSDNYSVKQSINYEFLRLHNLPVTCQSAASRPSENTGTDNDIRHTHICCQRRHPGLRRIITQALEAFPLILLSFSPKVYPVPFCALFTSLFWGHFSYAGTIAHASLFKYRPKSLFESSLSLTLKLSSRTSLVSCHPYFLCSKHPSPDIVGVPTPILLL